MLRLTARFLRHWKIVVGLMVLVAVAAFGVSLASPPTYEAGAFVVVELVTQSKASASLAMADHYSRTPSPICLRPCAPR